MDDLPKDRCPVCGDDWDLDNVDPKDMPAMCSNCGNTINSLDELITGGDDYAYVL